MHAQFILLLGFIRVLQGYTRAGGGSSEKSIEASLNLQHWDEPCALQATAEPKDQHEPAAFAQTITTPGLVCKSKNKIKTFI